MYRSGKTGLQGSTLLFSYWPPSFLILSIIESGVSKSSIGVEPSISPFRPVTVYFTYVGALLFHTCL